MAPRSVVHEEKSPYETPAEYRERRRIELARKPGTPAQGVNFESKRVRKAKRKALVRGYFANKVADVAANRADRAEFFRNLRLMKVARRKIAYDMAVLREQVRVLEQLVDQVEHRHPTVDLKLVDETHDLVHAAHKVVAVAADGWQTFSRQRIYYVKELAA